jgi:multiple sugar transport system permease protein
MALPCVIALLALIAFPLGSMLYNTFFKVNRFTPDIPARFVGFENYVDVFQDRYIGTAFSNTIYFVVVSVGLELLIGMGVALLLYQPLRGRVVIRTLLLSPMMIAPVVAGLQWRWLFADQYGALNAFLKGLGLPAPLWLADPNISMFSIIIVDVWISYPFVMLMFVAGLAGVPEELLEAAHIDGAGYWRRVWWIMLPSMRSIILITILMRVMDAFRVFDTIYVLTRGGPGVSTESISTYTYRTAFTNLKFESAGAMSVLAVLMVAVLSVVLVRVLRGSEVA